MGIVGYGFSVARLNSLYDELTGLGGGSKSSLYCVDCESIFNCSGTPCWSVYFGCIWRLPTTFLGMLMAAMFWYCYPTEKNHLQSINIFEEVKNGIPKRLGLEFLKNFKNSSHNLNGDNCTYIFIFHFLFFIKNFFLLFSMQLWLVHALD